MVLSFYVFNFMIYYDEGREIFMHPIYVLVGQNKIKLNEEVNNLIKDETDADIINFDLEESSVANMLEEINMIPFLYSKKIVIVKNPIILTNPTKYDEKLVMSFISYLNHPVDTTTLIFKINSLKDVNLKMLKELKNTSIIKEIQNPTDINLQDYITNSFYEDGYILDSLVVDELIERTKGNPDRLELEIDKLKTYKYDTKKILNADVRLLVSKELDDNIFELVNAVLENDILKVFSIFNDLMVLNTSETVILALLISKFNELYQVKTLTKAGMTKNEIADLFKVKPGRIYYLQKAAEQISLEVLKSNINQLTELDYKIKTGQIDKRLGVELFLLK